MGSSLRVVSRFGGSNSGGRFMGSQQMDQIFNLGDIRRLEVPPKWWSSLWLPFFNRQRRGATPKSSRGPFAWLPPTWVPNRLERMEAAEHAGGQARGLRHRQGAELRTHFAGDVRPGKNDRICEEGAGENGRKGGSYMGMGQS